MVLPDSDRIPRVPPYSGTALALQVFVYGTITLYGLAFQLILLTFQVRYEQPHNPSRKSNWFGLYRFRSPLLSVSLLIYFPTGT